MTIKNRHTLFSARGGIMGGRLKARLQVYTLGEGVDACLLFSLRVWAPARHNLSYGACAEAGSPPMLRTL